MRNTIITFVTLTLIVGRGLPAYSQSDSTHLDAGYLSLQKDFTQRIAIRGADLEKMPFLNLSDAISVWLYGAYTNPMTLQYVVDGNPVADVNAWSIFDVEEVVFVQHAAALIGAAPGQAEVVLIRTKRGKGPGGVCVAAQTGLIRARGEDGNMAKMQLFHNYYAQGYRTLGKFTFGASANYLQDAEPYSSPSEKLVTADNWRRWRLNGYLDWRPDAHNLVELTINYAPQQLSGQMDSVAGQPGAFASLAKAHQHFVVPHLDWRAQWGNGLANNLQATYLHSNLASADAFAFNTPAGEETQLISLNAKSYHLWIRDHLAYTSKLGGGWVLEPALNLSFEHFNDEIYEMLSSYNPYPLSQALNPNGYALQESIYGAGAKTNVILLVPALDLSYKGALDLQAGAMIHTGATSLTANGRQVYPFGGLTIDVLRLADEHAGNSLKIFASAVSETAPSDQAYMIEDFSNTAGYTSPFPTYNNSVLGSSGPPYGPPPGYVYPKPPAYPAWEAGLTYRGWGGRLELAYTFERRVSTTYGVVQLSNGWQTINLEDWHSSLHHVTFRVGVLDGPGLSWKTGLSVTLLRSTHDPNGAYNIVAPAAGDIAPQPWSWTGGWINRVQVKNFSAGFDLLCHLGETDSTGSGATKLNSFVTPNVFVGYRIALPTDRSVEFFVESRAIIVNKYSNLLDGRQYYTIGGKLCL